MARTMIESELEYVAKLRVGISTLSTEVLDDYRRCGEVIGGDIVLGDLTGDELAQLCEHEIAGRYAVGEAA